MPLISDSLPLWYCAVSGLYCSQGPCRVTHNRKQIPCNHVYTQSQTNHVYKRRQRQRGHKEYANEYVLSGAADILAPHPPLPPPPPQAPHAPAYPAPQVGGRSQRRRPLGLQGGRWASTALTPRCQPPSSQSPRPTQPAPCQWPAARRRAPRAPSATTPFRT